MGEQYDTDRILDYVEGELSSTEQAAFEQQLEQDPHLRRLVDQLGSDRQALRELPDLAAPPDLAEQAVHQLERRALLGEAPNEPPRRQPQRRATVGRLAGALAAAAVVVVTGAVILETLTQPPLLWEAQRWAVETESGETEDGQSPPADASDSMATADEDPADTQAAAPAPAESAREDGPAGEDTLMAMDPVERALQRGRMTQQQTDSQPAGADADQPTMARAEAFAESGPSQPRADEESTAPAETQQTRQAAAPEPDTDGAERPGTSEAPQANAPLALDEPSAEDAADRQAAYEADRESAEDQQMQSMSAPTPTPDPAASRPADDRAEDDVAGAGDALAEAGQQLSKRLDPSQPNFLEPRPKPTVTSRDRADSTPAGNENLWTEWTAMTTPAALDRRLRDYAAAHTMVFSDGPGDLTLMQRVRRRFAAAEGAGASHPRVVALPERDRWRLAAHLSDDDVIARETGAETEVFETALARAVDPMARPRWTFLFIVAQPAGPEDSNGSEPR